MEYLILKQDSPTWLWLWDEWLLNNPINAELDEPTIAENNGYMWEYFGTVRNKGIAISTFRHKSHPLDDQPKNISVQHLDQIPNEDIELNKPIK
jgi:hypothetical protein